MTSATSRRSSTDAAFRRPGRRKAALCLGLSLFALLALLAGLGTARGAAPPVSPDVGERARKIVADPRYQSSLPGEEAGGGGENPIRPPRGGDEPPDDPGAGGGPVRLPAVPAELGVVAQMLLYLLLAVGIVLAGMSLFQRLRRLRAAVPELAVPVQPQSPRSPRAERPERAPALDDAERLAAEGRWDEALHALLLQAIRLVSGRLPAPLPPSSTSRELLRLVPLAEEARQAFAGMVRAVELSLFGGAAVGAAVYEENRERLRIVSGRTA